MSINAGISDITFSIPRIYLPLANRDDPDKPTEFSLSRKDPRTNLPTNPRKYLYGIGVSKMSIPDTYQDPVTMVSNAIYDLIERNDIPPRNINRIEIGTESAPDMSKSIGMYTHGALEKRLGKGSLSRCAPPEGKAACAYTAFSLENALDWIRSGRSNGKCRIIGATDIAKYPLQTPGEHTQGAGAVAILVEKDPTLLDFDDIVGQYTEDEDTFYRPPSSPVAFVNGEGSEIKYDYAMREAFDDYGEQAIKSGLVKLAPGESLTDHFDLLSYHQPYPAKVKKSFASLLMHEWRKLPRWQNVVNEIGEEPKREKFVTDGEYQKSYDEYRKKFIDTKMFQGSFQRKVVDGQEFGTESGNSYTVSAWGHLASLLTGKESRGEDLTGKKGGIGFFGSGCVASGQSYTVVPGYENVVRKFNLTEKLKNRKAISLRDYEDLHEDRPLSEGREHVLPPENEFVLTGIKNGYRSYKFV
jgi:hydroxymethylglutaryl-CoA synthase